jgi:signal transduction histidine kinase
MLARTLHTFLQKFILPKSSNEDIRRKEFILNILLASFISLLVIGVVLDTIHSFSENSAEYSHNSLTTAVLVIILAYFALLYVLSRIGKPFLTAYLLVSTVFLLATYMGYRWGIDLPAELLFYVLAIVMGGILVESRFAYLLTVLSAVCIALFGSLSRVGVLEPNQYWRHESWSISDTIMVIVIYAIIATVSWLSNREIKNSLTRARQSEADLKLERDSLEIKIEARTKELQAAELERMRQAYKFVEFGKISGGLFHDLISPLTALSLNIQNIAASQGTNDPQRLTMLAEDVARAQSVTLHLQKMMESMRRHIANEAIDEEFSISTAIQEIVQTLHSYAQDNAVRIVINHLDPMRTVGNSVAFCQVITNLLSNGVEAFASTEAHLGESSVERVVFITARESAGMATICIEDTGAGIAEEHQESVFTPFFSTKSTRGLGIGLSLARRIIEKEFEGSLTFASTGGKGSTFTVYFPLREP